MDTDAHVIETDSQLSGGPGVGARAPEFIIEVPRGRLTLSELAAQFERLILISQDSYRFHSD